MKDASAQDSQVIDNLPDEDDNGRDFMPIVLTLDKTGKTLRDKAETENRKPLNQYFADLYLQNTTEIL